VNGSTHAVPISLALVAGGLSVINPCGFPLLPAFLSFYLGADERQLPTALTRIGQGLFVGGLVTLGFLGSFALVGLPVGYGVGTIARAVPWVGLATGAVLALLASGGYLSYFWARLHFGDTATVADDPIVSFGVRFSGRARSFADGHGAFVLAVALAIVVPRPGGGPLAATSTGSGKVRRTVNPAAAFAVMFALLGAGCGAGHGTTGSGQLMDLRNLGELRSLFNKRSGEPRLILLISPT